MRIEFEVIKLLPKNEKTGKIGCIVFTTLIYGQGQKSQTFDHFEEGKTKHEAVARAIAFACDRLKISE